MNGMNAIMAFLVIFLAGGIIGFLVCYLTLGRKKASAQQQELDETKIELQNYKSQVNDHFTSTAELMEEVASSYQALYSHMAGQSQTLFSDTSISPFPLLKPIAEEQHQEIPSEEQPQQEEETKSPAEESSAASAESIQPESTESQPTEPKPEAEVEKDAEQDNDKKTPETSKQP